MTRTPRPALVLAVMFLAAASIVPAQEIEEVQVIVPGPEADLFVDPITDVLAPAKAYLRPAAAEIEPARLDVSLAANELPASRAALRVGALEPDASTFLLPADDALELEEVETVTARGTRIPRQALARRATYDDLVRTRRARFGRTERNRSPLDP